MKGVRNFKAFCVSVIMLIGSWSVGYGQEWTKVINYGGINDALSICQTKDSAYWITGYRNDEDLTLTKLDINGKEIFHKIFPKRGYGLNVSSTKENGVLLADGGIGIFNGNHTEKISKIDKNGNVLWEYKVGGYADIKETTNENVIYTNFDSLGILDKNGNLLWKKHTPDSLNNITIASVNNNDFLISGIKVQTNTLVEYHYDYNGNLLSEKEVFNGQIIPIRGYVRNTDGSYILLNYNINNTELNICKVENKKLIWKKALAKGSKKTNILLIYDFIIDKNDNIVIHGADNYIAVNGSKSFAFIMVLDKNANIKSMQRFGEQFDNDFSGLIESNDGYYVACGWHNAQVGTNLPFVAWVIKTKAVVLSKSLFGKIAIDENNNCKVDSLENSAKGWTIEAENNNNKTKNYAFIDNNGNYSFLADTGTYNLKIKIPSPYYSQICNNTVSIADSAVSTQKDLFLQKTTDCPYTTVDIAARNFRPCFDAILVVNFCNQGSATAQNAYVQVQLDTNLTYLQSSIAGISQGNNKYRFALGDLPVDSCGYFTITTKVACDNSLLGKTLCNVAHIYPDSLCAPQDLGKIQVTGTCNGATIKFDIKNDAEKAMNTNKNYIIIEDDVMYMQGSFKLNPNEIKPVTVQAKAGKTYRLIAEQTNPIYGAIASTAFENCNVSTSATTGFINQFPQGDDSPFEDTDCRVVGASYDPNDKQAVPQGVKNQHFIAKNTDLEYMIRFQNKGTDTAFLVIVKDTLSQSFDPASIIPGASSHPYKFDLTDRGIAKFIFSGINLPHQKVNDEGSNGFVKFRIKQRRDLPNGTVIKNKAAIYFDYNDPIITNETFHTIGENWALILPNKEIATESLDVKIYPNPFSESTRIEAQISKEHNSLIFNVLDANGSVIRSEIFSGNALDFQRNGLQAGFYFYEIKSENKRLGTGKLVVF